MTEPQVQEPDDGSGIDQHSMLGEDASRAVQRALADGYVDLVDFDD